ncbi:holo-[acyl-carrier-protein] synthase [Anaerobacterium chartisolvens]|uniref:Holo-[acyl-carrier-protein] synthase n=2 Tax=Anaerobacterium chartisolvens TaxID=1297424 RepID=A0A369ANM5_9FIRM|nr:holo-[acyl-carrier-protein] synthase [Anaerobacterium chartisolvens]
MVLGIGTDILKIDRIRKSYTSNEDSFIKKTYTYKEQKQAVERSDPALYFATRYAGKEAVFKSLGIDGNIIKLNEIEILGTDTGQPKVTLLGKLKDIAAQKGVVNVYISLSYDTDYAVAYAIVESYIV